MPSLDYSVFGIFHCKKGCKTLFEEPYITEMEKFSYAVSALPMWRHVCLRRDNGSVRERTIDSSGCSGGSYNNLTIQMFEMSAGGKDKEDILEYVKQNLDRFIRE